MKKIVLITIFLFSALNLISQPISGFLGKRLMTSFELEVLPGFQSYEANKSGFLVPRVFDPRSYTPRLYINADYQVFRNMALSGSVGYSKMRVSFWDIYAQSMNTYIVQLRIKKGIGNAKFPTSSSYLATGIGLYFGNIQDAILAEYDEYDDSRKVVGSTDVNTMNLALNLELGRRIVLNGGFLIDFGVAANLSTGIKGIGNYNRNYTEDITEDFILESMKNRMFLNSLFNFKIGVGYFVR